MKLLIEIGVEELPAIPFLKELENIKPKWDGALAAFGLENRVCIDYTPRRIVISGEVAEFSPDLEVENIGAPKHLALQNGQWSKAAISFANKCGISVDELRFKEIKSKEVLYHKSIVKGEMAGQILPKAINNFIKSLNFGKSMRWGEFDFEFIRPVRSIVCMLENESIDCELFAQKSKKAFFPHRRYGYEMIEFSSIDEYFDLLAKNGVILKPSHRRDKILNEFKEIEAKTGLKIEIDEELLDEVVAITEYPTALLGEFESEFLEVPSEVIITSMKENQRYFAVYDNGKLSNHFVVVSNAITDDYGLIIKGNEKVLRARLSDAKFFWQSDLASGLDSQKLKNITYLNELGSMYDKELRELEIAMKLAKVYEKKLKDEVGDDYEALLKRAIMLSKADLSTQMVYEFTNLQGIMGGYYSQSMGENEFVVSAIKEQYLPNLENSKCPGSLFGSIVAMANKLDNIMSLFSINKIPTGNKDPYALRRGANGIIKIVLNQNINFDIKEILSLICENYKKFDLKLVEEFILDRLYTMYKANSSIIKACINTDQRDIKMLNSAILALDEICKDESFKQNFSTFKRLANIIKDSEIKAVNEELFDDENEKRLNDKFNSLKLDINDTKGYLQNLFGLKNEIDTFFDKVIINHENEVIKTNRIALIGQIYKAFLRIADIKEISAND